MEIKTRFNIGDEVYPIKKYYTGDWRKSQYRIADVGSIEIKHILVLGKQKIRYSNGIRSEFFEEDCFSTKEEAQIECDRRNNG